MKQKNVIGLLNYSYKIIILLLIVGNSTFSQSVWEWSNPKPCGTDLSNIAYGNGLFVTVGTMGAINTSGDCKNWVTRNSGTLATLRSVAYGNNQFIAVGDSNLILSSSDGLVWSKLTSGGSAVYKSVTFGDNKFVVVGNYLMGYVLRPIILSSVDGIQWKKWLPEDSPGNDIILTSAAFGNHQFVAMGYAVTYSSLGDTAWQYASIWMNLIKSVTYGNNKFVAVGAFGKIMTSTDCKLWLKCDSLTSEHFISVCYGNNQYKILGERGTMLSSTDGVAWVKTNPLTEYKLFSISYILDNFIIVGELHAVISSQDGITWAINTPVSKEQLNCINYFKNILVVVGAQGTIITSDDSAKTWCKQLSRTTNNLKSATSDGNQLVAVGESGTILTSLNGKEWVERVSGTKCYLYDVVFGNNKFIAVGTGINDTILISPNGVTWSKISTNFRVSFFKSVAYNNNLFVACGGKKSILTSPDGLNWAVELYDSLSNDVISPVEFVNGQYVAFYGKRGLYTSKDGKLWDINVFNSSYNQYNSIAYGNNSHVVVGVQLLKPWGIYSSQDLNTWTSNSLNSNENLNSVIFAFNKFITVGTRGTVLTSQCDIITENKLKPKSTQSSKIDIMVNNNKLIIKYPENNGTKDVSVKVFNIGGKLIYSCVNDLSTNSIVVLPKNISNGLYIITISTKLNNTIKTPFIYYKR